MRAFAAKTYSVRVCALTALFFSILFTSAQAQEDPLTILGRVVLGLGGGEQVAIETPQAVTVLNLQDLEREAASTPGELLENVPGVQVVGTGNPLGQSFNIRGIGETTSGDESKIIITVDGATKFYEQYRLGSFFSDPELYKRVEVLRGPASSTLYGSGALGGVIAFETKDPMDFIQDGKDSAIRVRSGYQSNGAEILGSATYASRIENEAEAMIAFNHRRTDEYIDGAGVEIVGSAFASNSVLAKYKSQLGNGADLTLSLSVWDSDLNDTEYSAIDGTDFGTVDRHTRDLSAALRYQSDDSGFAGGELDMTLALSDTTVQQTDAEGVAFGPPGSPPTGCPAVTLFCDSTYGYKTISLDIKNVNNFELSGWDSYLTSGAQIASQTRSADSNFGGYGYHPEGKDFQAGAFFQLEAIRNDSLTLIPGVRVDHQHLRAGQGVAGADSFHTEVSPKFAVHYQVSDNIAVFGSVARTHRMPTLDEVYGLDERGTTVASVDLDPEIADTVELGFSASTQELFTQTDGAQLKVTAFSSDIKDRIDNTGGAGEQTNSNDGSATIKGFEIEGAYESDRAFGRLAYSNVTGTDQDGENLNSVPANSLALTLGGRSNDGTLEYGWRGNFVSKITIDTDDFDAYTVHDIFIDWTPDQGLLEGTTVSFSVNNVTDAVYQNSLGGGTNGQGQSLNLMLTTSF